MLALLVALAAPAQAAECPCTIFSPGAAPAGETGLNDGQPLEVGVKFRTDEDGYVTALRFYKVAGNTGTHIGHLWSADGTQLAEATFADESASGWQEARLATPVAVTKGTAYVASYFSADGGYYRDLFSFSTTGIDAPPLHALGDGVDGPNGAYHYGERGGFPTDSFEASNYWVDAVFERTVATDTTPPGVVRTTPADLAADVDPATSVTAVFDEPIDAATVMAQTFVRRSDGAAVSADVSYDAATQTATLTPLARLDRATVFTAILRGGAGTIADLAGNPLAADHTWTFTTAAAPPSPPNGGPGGGTTTTPSGGTTTVTPPATAPPIAARPQGSAGAGTSVASAPDVRDLRAVGALSLRAFARGGLTVAAVVPADSRVVEIRLYRVVPARDARGRARTRRVLAPTGVLRIGHGGRVTVRWRPRRADVARLRTGTYVLSVRAGRDRTHLAGRAAERAIKLTGAPVPARPR